VGEKWPGKFSLKVPDFHVAFRDLLPVVNLRQGTHNFTSLPKEGVLRIFFFALKNPTASGGFEPANLGSVALLYLWSSVIQISGKIYIYLFSKFGHTFMKM
jgi:hypothetical protein